MCKKVSDKVPEEARRKTNKRLYLLLKNFSHTFSHTFFTHLFHTFFAMFLGMLGEMFLACKINQFFLDDFCKSGLDGQKVEQKNLSAKIRHGHRLHACLA